MAASAAGRVGQRAGRDESQQQGFGQNAVLVLMLADLIANPRAVNRTGNRQALRSWLVE